MKKVWSVIAAVALSLAITVTTMAAPSPSASDIVTVVDGGGTGSNTNGSGSGAKSPKTGQSADVLPMALMGTALAGMGISFYMGRRKEVR